MSKLSRFLIGIIVVGLAFIASLHLYRAYEKYATEQNAEPAATMTFNQVPVSYIPPEPEEPIFRRWPSDEQRAQQEIYLQDTPLTQEAAKTAARQTVRSVLADYQQDPKLQAFYKDLQQATGENIDLSMLSGEQLGSLLTQYPQIQEVIARYSKDPEFVRTLQAIFSNPQFAQSVAILQQESVK